MGLKDAGKKRMQEAGVPTTPGYLGEDQSPERLASEADIIGYPILIKAVAGGGGKGMRRVDRSEDFADALQSCQREAASSFSNAHVLLEKWIVSRSEEHTSELQSLMRISYAVFCLKTKHTPHPNT